MHRAQGTGTWALLTMASQAGERRAARLWQPPRWRWVQLHLRKPLALSRLLDSALKGCCYHKSGCQQLTAGRPVREQIGQRPPVQSMYLYAIYCSSFSLYQR